MGYLLTFSRTPLSCAGARRSKNHNLHASHMRDRDHDALPGGGNKKTTAPASCLQELRPPSSSIEIFGSFSGSAVTDAAGVPVDALLRTLWGYLSAICPTSPDLNTSPSTIIRWIRRYCQLPVPVPCCAHGVAFGRSQRIKGSEENAWWTVRAMAGMELSVRWFMY